jgi:hypothetical protein
MMRYRGSHTTMVIFLVFWQVARNPPKEIKFQSRTHLRARHNNCYSRIEERVKTGSGQERDERGRRVGR